MLILLHICVAVAFYPRYAYICIVYLYELCTQLRLTTVFKEQKMRRDEMIIRDFSFFSLSRELHTDKESQATACLAVNKSDACRLPTEWCTVERRSTGMNARC